jgi:hypothetical protein
MATQETGHSKNVANFETVISIVQSFGGAYAPKLSTITVANLQATATAAKNSITGWRHNYAGYTNAVSKRLIAFNELKTKSTRIINALAASGVNAEVISSARSINKKLQGVRAKALVKESVGTGGGGSPQPEEPKHISASQQSFDTKVEHLNGIIELLQLHPEYDPNEAELKIAALQTYLKALQKANQDVVAANTNLNASRIDRNAILYGDGTGLYSIVSKVKDYVLSVYGNSSPQYKQVSKIKFTIKK